MLTETDLIRYGRQISYPGFGMEGQRKLKESHVVVAGVGGLGCSAAMYLACAGVGHITLVDCDLVELSNLNRQILYLDEDIGGKKPLLAAQKIAKLNPSVKVKPVFEKITADNVRAIIRGANTVIDGTDNFETRFILNSACVAERIPFVHAGVHGLLGEITTIVPGKTPCLACIFPGVPKKPKEIPIFGVTPALIATLQVMETIKLLAGFGDLLAGTMLYVHGDRVEFTFIKLTRKPDCSVCGSIGNESGG